MSKIDLATLKYCDFETLYSCGLITDEDVEYAKQVCGADYDYNFWELTIDDLGTIMDGNVPERVANMYKIEDITCLEFFRRTNAFEQFMVHFCDILESMSLKQTPQEIKASKNLPKFTKIEGFLVFAQKYFNLPNFTVAGQITLGDFYLAKKNALIEAMFNRNIAMQSMKKSGAK